jgi:hypothetical protein
MGQSGGNGNQHRAAAFPMTAPLLSIVTVVRNDLHGLKRTLRSIEAQLSALKTLPTELLIVDGASGDGSLQVAEAFRDKRGLPVRLLQQPPQGVYPAMNLAWRQARGQWLIYVNAGDLLGDVHPLTEALQTNDASVWAYQGRSAMQPPGLNWAVEVLSEQVHCHQALTYRRELHQRLGPYDERLKVCADTAFMRRIPPQQWQFLPALLAVSTVSPSDLSRTPRAIRRDLQALRQIQPDLRLWPRARLSLAILEIERLLQVSWSVWIRAGLGLLRGSHRLVNLG